MYEHIDADAQGDTIRDGEDFIEVLDAFLGFDLREDHDAATRKPEHLHAINKSSQRRSRRCLSRGGEAQGREAQQDQEAPTAMPHHHHTPKPSKACGGSTGMPQHDDTARQRPLIAYLTSA
jgi:hypothetical protein